MDDRIATRVVTKRRSSVKLPSAAPLQPDETDIVIMQRLFQGERFYPARTEIRESISEVSRGLGITESTVRKRIEKYFKSGFVRGWNLILNPNITGESIAQVRLDVMPPSTKDDVLRKFKLIDGVWIVVRYHENVVGVGLYYRRVESLKKNIELLSRIANSEHVEYGLWALPPSTFSFRPADIAVLRCIREDPKKEYARIADETKMAIRTVRRSIGRMIRERALFLGPVPDFRKITGVVPADFFVSYTSQNAARENEPKLISIAGRRMYFGLLRNPEHAFLQTFLASTNEGEEILAKLNRLEGVKAAYMDLVSEYAVIPQMFRNRIDEITEQQSQIAVLRR